MTIVQKQTPLKMSRMQAKMITVMLDSPNVSAGCKALNICRDTWYRAMKDPIFKAEYDLRSREYAKQSLSELKLSIAPAVQVLYRLLTDKNSNVRLKASQTIIEMGLKAIDLEEIQPKLAEIESRQTRGMRYD